MDGWMDGWVSVVSAINESVNERTNDCLGLDYRQRCSGNKDFFRENKFLLPEQKSIDGNVHARPVGDIFSEHMSTY